MTVEQEQGSEQTAEVARLRLDPSDLRAVTSFEDAARLLAEHGVAVADATTEIGDGFTLLDDKSALLNVPFLALQWTFAAGDFGPDSEFVVMRVLTSNGDKFIITDGGTGLYQQVRDYYDRTGSDGGLLVRRGLRKSEYDNEHGHGVTFYLNV